MLRQWDIVLVPYPTANNPHYLVLLSPDPLAGNTDFQNLNGLVCSTIRPPDRPIRSHEVFLDQADSFDHKTACRCHLIIEFSLKTSSKRRDASRSHDKQPSDASYGKFLAFS
jgi:hypothetical protein